MCERVCAHMCVGGGGGLELKCNLVLCMIAKNGASKIQLDGMWGGGQLAVR